MIHGRKSCRKKRFAKCEIDLVLFESVINVLKFYFYFIWVFKSKFDASTKCFKGVAMYVLRATIFLIRFMASSQSARSPKAVKRIYPSPLGPKPTPGVPTTLASYSICSKEFPRAYLARRLHPQVGGVLSAENFESCTFQRFFHDASVSHIILYDGFHLLFAFGGIDRFGTTLGDIGCAVELGALAAVPHPVQRNALSFQRGGCEFFRYDGVSATHPR